jgi:hypothetical protein
MSSCTLASRRTVGEEPSLNSIQEPLQLSSFHPSPMISHVWNHSFANDCQASCLNSWTDAQSKDHDFVIHPQFPRFCDPRSGYNPTAANEQYHRGSLHYMSQTITQRPDDWIDLEDVIPGAFSLLKGERPTLSENTARHSSQTPDPSVTKEEAVNDYLHTDGGRNKAQSKHSEHGRGQEDASMDTTEPLKTTRRRMSRSSGELRLRIKFENYGTCGEVKQHFGTRNFIIPDGLSGTTELYHENWRFKVNHHCHTDQSVTIEWIIINLSSQITISRQETINECRARETGGITICNQVLKQALDTRAAELEAELQVAEAEHNQTRISSLTGRIAYLRPTRCTMGLLFFGLLHDCVQQHMISLEHGETFV